MTKIFSRRNLLIENLALRQQLALYRHKYGRPRAGLFTRLFWVLLSRFWKGWKETLAIVSPATVVKWHRLGFRLFWRWKSGTPPGRPPTPPEARTLILCMASENLGWGAPRIHGELEKLGIRIGERSVSRIMQKAGFEPYPYRDSRRQSWKLFIRNHLACTAAMDFLVVPTAFFGLLYVLVVIDHARRKILHFNVTFHPTDEWTANQIRQAFQDTHHIRYLHRDRDAIFGEKVMKTLDAFNIISVVSGYHYPWQNGYAERVIGSIRRELLAHVIVINEFHLRKLLKEYVSYYNADRTHLGLNKDSPEGRPVEAPTPGSKLIALPRNNGLHHRYVWQEHCLAA